MSYSKKGCLQQQAIGTDKNSSFPFQSFKKKSDENPCVSQKMTLHNSMKKNPQNNENWYLFNDVMIWN